MALPTGKRVSYASHAGKLYQFTIESDKLTTKLLCQRSQLTQTDLTLKLIPSGRRDTTRVTLPDAHPERTQSDILDCRPLLVAETQLQCLFVLTRTQARRGGPDRLSLFACLDDPTGHCSLTAVGAAQQYEQYDQCEWPPRLLDGPVLLSKTNGAIQLILLRPNIKGNKSWTIPNANVNGYRLLDAVLEFYWKSSVLYGCLTMIVVSASGAARLQATLSLAITKHVPVHECWKLGPGDQILEYLEQASAALLWPRSKSCGEQVLFVVTEGTDACLVGVRDRSVPMDCRTCAVPVGEVVALDYFRCGPGVTKCCALTSRGGGHCLVNVDSFQVIHTREKVLAMLADDFLGTGDQQIFYMFKKSTNRDEPSTSSSVDVNFEITNLRDTFCAKGAASTTPTDSSLSTVRQALHNRIFEEKLLQSEADSHLLHLQRTVLDIEKTLGRLAVGDQGKFNEKPYMFQLLTGTSAKPTRTERQVQQSKPEDGDHNCRPLDTEPPWQRILMDTWVIGVRVTNRSHKRISNFHIVLSAPDMDVAHETNFVRADHHQADQPEWPDSLEPGQQAILMCAVHTDILDHRESLAVDLSITFKSSRGQSVATSGCVTVSPPVVLQARDLVGNTLGMALCGDPNGDYPEAIIDFAALRATTNPTMVCVVSTGTNLATLQALLDIKTKFILNERFQIHVWQATAWPILNGAWLQVCPNNFDWTSTDMIVHSRSRVQFFAVIHYLNTCFPSDVSFKEIISKKDLSTKLETAFKDEAVFVSNFLEDAIDQPHDSPDDVMVLAHDRDVLLGAEAYRKFRNDLYELETQSDLAFATALSMQSKF